MPGNTKALLKSKGRLWVLDEAASVKAFKEITVVDNVEVKHPANVTEIKTPSGITIFKTTEPGASISFDWYHPGDLANIERLFRGVVEITTLDGLTAVSGEKVMLEVRKTGEVIVLPGFDGDRSAVTVSSVKSEDELTTYTVTTDYTVAADSATGMTLITHVGAGSIAVGSKVVVTFTYTPLASKIVKPNYDGNIIDRYLVLDTFPVKSDTTKYRRYFLPRATVTTDMMHKILEVGRDNTSPNILPITMELAMPDTGVYEPAWYWIDTYNV